MQGKEATKKEICLRSDHNPRNVIYCEIYRLTGNISPNLPTNIQISENPFFYENLMHMLTH